MSRRIDYLEDPDAPKPTKIVPAANVIVLNDRGEILLIRRSDNGNFALPGGAMDLGESLTETAARECLEETGYQIAVDGLVGVFTNPGHVMEYTSNGEVRQEFAVVFFGHLVGGAPRRSEESTEIKWIPQHEIPWLIPMHPSMRYRIHLFVSGLVPHIDRPREISEYLANHSQPDSGGK